MVDIVLRLNQREIARLTAPGGSADQAAARLAGTVVDRARQIVRDEGRSATGAAGLVGSIRILSKSNTPTEATYTVGSDLPYAVAQHEGVDHRVYPAYGRVLAFPPPRKNVHAVPRRALAKQQGMVIVASVSGYEGIHYLTRALDSLRASDAT